MHKFYATFHIVQTWQWVPTVLQCNLLVGDRLMAFWFKNSTNALLIDILWHSQTNLNKFRIPPCTLSVWPSPLTFTKKMWYLSAKFMTRLGLLAKNFKRILLLLWVFSLTYKKMNFWEKVFLSNWLLFLNY